MPMNNGIVNLLIKVTLQNTASPRPLTPRFQILADSQDTPPGLQSFSCGGLGDNDQNLLKDILQKIVKAYPSSPISLCVSGTDILSDAACVGAPAAPELDATARQSAAAPAGGTLRRSAAAKAAPEKAAPVKTKPMKARSKKAVSKTPSAEKSTRKKTAHKSTRPEKKAATSSARKKRTRKTR